MADALGIIFLVGYGLIFLSGSTLNLITMYVLAFDNNLRKKLASVRWLMFGESLSEFLVSFVAVPLIMASTIVGDASPFSTVPFLCGATFLVGFGTAEVSYWYQAAIALTRLAAVLAPTWYRQYVRTWYANAVLFVLPWALTYSVFVVSALAKAYYIGAAPGSGTCMPLPYSDSPEAAASYSAYLLSDTLINVWASMCIALMCYITIYSYKWWSKIAKKNAAINQVQPLTTQQAARSQTNNNVVVERVESVPSNKKTVVNNTTNGATADVQLARVRRMHEERDKKIKLLAISCAVSIAIVFPCNIVYSLNYFDAVQASAPALASLFVFSSFVTFPLNPLLYLLVSADFRQAYRHIFKCSS